MKIAPADRAALDINNINHVGIAVRNLTATARRYEAMGFQLTPYSPHSAAWKPGELVQPLGSGNRCVMFENNYLEILASEDPNKPAARITNFLKHHQGAHIICFDCEDCEFVDKRVRSQGIQTSGVIPLQREIDTPNGMRTAKFERTQFAPENSPEGYIQASRHLTPEYIYQPRYINHANGCFQLSEAIMIADDLPAITKRYQAYIGAIPLQQGAVVRFPLPLNTTLTLVSARDASAMLPGSLWPPLPGIAAVAFRTKTMEGFKDLLCGHGFTVVEIGDRLLIPAEEACGVAVLFGT